MLGLSNTDVLGKIGLLLSVVTTLGAGIESFFNWRTKWTDADASLASWYSVKDKLVWWSHAQDSPGAEESLDRLFSEYRLLWDTWSARWILDQRGDAGVSGEGHQRT